MKLIKPIDNEQWPRREVKTIKCRKRDLVIRIADWSRQSMETGEPAYDVEVYIGGVYDWDQSDSFTLRKYKTKAEMKSQAVRFARAKIAELL